MYSNFFNLINANIVTLNRKIPLGNSITVKDGIIHSINNPVNDAESIDVHGGTVIPGFIDSHFHLRNLGKRLDMVQLKGIDSLEKIKNLVISECNRKKPGDIIFGFGWDQNLWESKDFPDEDVLNSIALENPIIFTRIDGHATWVNQKCLDDAGYSFDQGVPDGGKIINRCILVDNAMQITRG